MILRLLLLFTSLILLGSCDKVIHKNDARAENALDSMIEQYSYPENDNFTSKRVNSKEDITGNWVGSFNVPQSYMNAYIFFTNSIPSTWCFFAAILSGCIYWIIVKTHSLSTKTVHI